MKAPQIFSFFSGIGFLDLGFEKAGYISAFVNEFDPDFLSAYQYARKQMKVKQPVYGYLQGSAEAVLAGRIRTGEGVSVSGQFSFLIFSKENAMCVSQGISLGKDLKYGDFLKNPIKIIRSRSWGAPNSIALINRSNKI